MLFKVADENIGNGIKNSTSTPTAIPKVKHLGKN